ncbi:MAG TPA: hypothetical protein VHG69_02000 [Thermoleophilaceae bacterium]|nr:hypothetical protein [Thermoleophilaceae bacterium]
MTEPTEEQILEQLKNLKIDDVLLQTVVTVINLTGRKLTVEEEKDVEQARKGIEAARALLPLLPEEGIQPVKDALSQLQMLYVRETQGGSEPAEPEPPPKPKVDIWTPPGTQT